MFTRRSRRLLSILLPALALSAPCHALVELEDEQMSSVTGTGLAFVFDDFSMRMAPTSYVELIGSEPTAAAAAMGWKRGDARYYGLSMTSGSSAGNDWYDNGCGTGLGCPLGVGDGDYGVTAFASVYDPYMLRVFEYPGFDYQGDWRGIDPGNLATGTGVLAMPTILEFRGPSNTDPWRWAFWGELEVDRLNNNASFGACNNSAGGCGSGADFLQSQTIILGKPVALGHTWGGLDETTGADLGYTDSGSRPAILRLMQTANAADPTLGVTYQSSLSGDFRFSVRKAGTEISEGLHQVPDFDNAEGVHFKNVDAFLPLGTLHYQALTFSGVSGYDSDANPVAPVQNGNFSVELTRIPDDPNIYSHFYAGVTDGSCVSVGSGDCLFTAGGFIATPNPDTHGYVRWGNWCTDETCSAVIDPYSTANLGTGAYDLPTATSTSNGIYFVGGNTGDTGGATPFSPTSVPVNLGISRIEGMTIHHLKLTTLGAGT